MRRIVILGAGFAGLEAAVTLDRLFRNSSDFEILVIGDQNYFMFTPLLPQIASSYLDPRHIVQAVREIRGARGFRFRRDSARAIDVGRRRVILADDAIDCDYVIVAPGSRTDYFGVPGAREHTFDFKTLEDAVVLRERVLDVCEHAAHIADQEERRRLLTFAVVGGGYSGVELVNELRDLLFRYVVRSYRGIPPEEIRLILFDAGDTILTGVHPALRRHALDRLKSEGIDVRYRARVTRCFDGGLEINGKDSLAAATVIWTAGVRAHELVESLPGPHDRIGRAIVNEFLQLEGHPEVFVAGDSAAATSAPDAPRVAPVALAQGKLAARNIAHRERGEPLESYRYVAQGMLVELGMNDAVVNIAGIRWHGYLAWLFWNAVHLYRLVGIKKQVQVALDWSLATLFPRDTAIIRRQRACPLCNIAGRSASP
jgi:NADH:quinone reductase (non-electrogenic)